MKSLPNGLVTPNASEAEREALIRAAVAGKRKLNVLIVSWYFPPINEIGAVRVGKFAEYLSKSGNNVWVLTARREHADASLAQDFPEDHVLRVPWIDIDFLSSPWMWARREPTGGGGGSKQPQRMARSRPLRDKLAENYAALVRLPDRQVGWLPYMLRAGNSFLKSNNIDLIFASGPPFTTFVGASRLARRFGIPWIAEYRDGWSRYHYSPKPEWRERIDERMENRTTASAAGIVAVSEPWGDFYSNRFGKPTASIYNGFDPDAVAPAKPRKIDPSGPVVIVHMGTLYPGLRDPTILYQAIAKSGLAPTDVEVRYHGPSAAEVMPLAERMGVAAFVKVGERLPYAKALEAQRENDILLLLQSPSDAANVPAKTFEYFAARRPILGLGLDEGIPARLVRDRNAGFYRTDVDAVAEQLKKWVAEKRERGFIADLDESTSAGLSRAEQFDQLDTFLRNLLDSRAPVIGRPRSGRPTEMFPASQDAIIQFPAASKPQLLVIVDAEEEFDWHEPFSEKATQVTTMKLQAAAHRIFGRYGIVPSYAIDYPVASQPDGYGPLLDFLKDGLCDLGAQLHPWVTPPHGEVICERNSFPGNLDRATEFAKLKSLTLSIEENLGVRPRLYRAGRYGSGPNTAAILSELGYTMDCSVLPEGARSSPFAPDYRGAPVTPYWFGRNSEILEIPVTTSALGLARRASPALGQFLSSPLVNHLKIPAIMARLRLLDRIRLSPEGNTLDEAKRLTRFLVSGGQKIFVISYHSPSLGIGHTPYVQSRADLDRFMDWLEGYMQFFFGEIGGVASTPGKVLQWATEIRSKN